MMQLVKKKEILYAPRVHVCMNGAKKVAGNVFPWSPHPPCDGSLNLQIN